MNLGNPNADFNNDVVTLPNNATSQIDSLIDQMTAKPAIDDTVLPEVTVKSSAIPLYFVLAVGALVLFSRK